MARMVDVAQDKVDCWLAGSIPLTCPKGAGVCMCKLKLGDSINGSLHRILDRAVGRW